MDHAGWRSRGYLPHCDERGLVQHIVFGLADAMPKSVPASISDPAKRADWADRTLDRGHGSRLLTKREHAAEVQRCLLHDDGGRYALVAWCVMPTHVHVVAEQISGHLLADIVQTWKSVTSHTINKAESRKGQLWRREYFDRFMRSEEQFAWTVEYVERNPVTARLVETPEAWPFSSAAGAANMDRRRPRRLHRHNRIDRRVNEPPLPARAPAVHISACRAIAAR